MSNLTNLYAKRKVFTDYNAPIPQDLAKEIADEEARLLSDVAESIISFLPEEIDLPDSGSIVVGAEYIDGKLTRVASSCNLDIASAFSNVQLVNVDEDQGEDDNSGENDPARKRGPSIGFMVKFADGKEIKYKTARRTMIEALKYMGLERASKFRGEMFKGYPLIGKKQRPTEPGRIWQKNVDGWWIYVNLSNSRAITCLKGVSDMLNIPLEIIMDKEDFEPEPQVMSKGTRTKYALNDGEPTWKNRTVLNVVRALLRELPEVTFEQVCDYFPKRLQGSYGVVCSLDEIARRRQRNQTEDNRWFLDPSEILTSADGIKFAVSNEWGDNFTDFRNHIAKEFGWSIKEI